jgi:hypothetical protein
MTYTFEVNDDLDMDELLKNAYESIRNGKGKNISYVIELKDDSNPEEQVYSEFDDILKETITTSLLKRAIHEFEIVENYIKAFDSSDIRWEEIVEISFNEDSHFDQFKFMVENLIADQLKILNLMDYDILNQMENIIVPIISEKLLLLISDFKDEYKQYKYNEHARHLEEIRAEQESMKDETTIDNQDDSNPRRTEVYIVVKNEFIILTRYLDECQSLGSNNHSRHWLTEAFMTHYKGEDYIFTEQDMYGTKMEAIQRITQLDNLY